MQTEPPVGGAVALPVVGSCLVCSRATRLIAEWREPGEGLCWFCEAQRWILVRPDDAVAPPRRDI